MIRFKLLCPECKGNNISVRTEVRWDDERQDWIPYCVHYESEMECIDCDKLFPFEFTEVDDGF